MKPLIFACSLLTLLLCPSCFTAMTVSSMQIEGYATFYPDSIWLSNDGKTVGFLGSASNEKGREVSYILIPRNDLARLGADKGIVAMSDLARVSNSGEIILRIHKGSIPNGFSRLGGVTKGESPVSIKTTAPSNPGAILLLPITIVVDVVTLPIQIPAMNNLSKIH